jgi:hypothetical protein
VTRCFLLLIVLVVGCGGSTLQPDHKDAGADRGQSPDVDARADEAADQATDQGAPIDREVDQAAPDLPIDRNVDGVVDAGAPDLLPDAYHYAVDGPSGTTILTTVYPPDFTADSSCADFPDGLFTRTFAAGCVRITSVMSTVRICFANPNLPGQNEGRVLLCTPPVSSCPRSGLISQVCCRELFPSSGPDPLCSDTDELGTYAAGVPKDTDGDFIIDISDNCPTVFNPDQADSNNDGIGDACEGDGGTDGPGSNPG